MNGEIAFTASYKVSLNRTFSTWVNDQPAGLSERRENKMWHDRDELERTLNHTVLDLCLCVIFRWPFPWSLSAFPHSLDLPMASVPGKGIENVFWWCPRTQHAFLHPLPQSGHPANWEGFEASWQGTKQTKIVQCGKDMTKGIWKNSAEPHVWWEKKK